jgi:diguanylate cyclase (GGDEF)-like protein
MTRVTRRSWLCPTDLDRQRVLEAGSRVRMIRNVGSAGVGVALLAATPWLGWWTLILFALSAANFLSVDWRMARAARPERVSVEAILLTLVLLAAGVVLSGGPRSPALPWLVLPAGMVAARFRAQVVSAGIALTVGAILAVTLGADAPATIADPVPVLSTLALLVGVVSIVLALQAAELHQRTEATVDPLTGLSNRRQLVRDLQSACEEASSEQPVWLVMFDLDGFKAYNDMFGHLGGDLLLERLARRFSAALADVGRAYRLGGDEFCALVWRGHGEELIDACLAGLTAEGEGFRITSSYGVVTVPDEAGEVERVLELADERMYSFKDSRRTSAGRQTRDLALQVIAAHEPALHEHAAKVAQLTEAVARRMGLTGQDLADAIRAAELHDIGKVAIPYSILHHAGPLDDEEWRLMYRHPAIGASILAAAPALARVAEIVEATHERYDGTGYPRGLRGREIPLGSRIVFVCDSFDSMVTETPFGEALSEHRALSELRRCAGTQFDPEVVHAFVMEHELRDVMALQTRPRAALPSAPALG